MTGPFLIDTDVAIDYLRRHPAAVAFVRSLSDEPSLPATVVGELYAGVRDGNERAELGAFIAAASVIVLDAEIATVGGLFRRQYGKSHNVSFNDAMIAATADVRGMTLVTLNRKHFPMLTNVFVPYIKP